MHHSGLNTVEIWSLHAVIYGENYRGTMEPGIRLTLHRNLILLIKVRPKYEIAFVLSSCTGPNVTISCLILAINLEPLVERAPGFSREGLWEWKLYFSMHNWICLQAAAWYWYCGCSHTNKDPTKTTAEGTCHLHNPWWNSSYELYSSAHNSCKEYLPFWLYSFKWEVVFHIFPDPFPLNQITLFLLLSLQVHHFLHFWLNSYLVHFLLLLLHFLHFCTTSTILSCAAKHMGALLDPSP